MLKQKPAPCFEKWPYKITGRTAKTFRNHECERGQKCRSACIKVLQEILPVTTGSAKQTVKRLIKGFETETEAHKIERLIGRLYDFCDSFGVFIELFD